MKNQTDLGHEPRAVAVGPGIGPFTFLSLSFLISKMGAMRVPSSWGSHIFILSSLL